MIVTKQQRLLGIGLLLFVNVVWVLSAELTRHLFIDLDFARPFFFTYAKSCMLSLFLLRYACSCPTAGSSCTGDSATAAGSDVGGKKKKSTKTTKSGKAIYTQLDNFVLASDAEEEEEEDDGSDARGDENCRGAEKRKRRRRSREMNIETNSNNDMNNNMSTSSDKAGQQQQQDEEGDEEDEAEGERDSSERSYETQNLTNVEFERFQLPSSATDESPLDSDDEALLRRDPAQLDIMNRQLFNALFDKQARQQQRKRRVRFSCIRQVRALPEKVAMDARLARLPYHRQIVERFQHCPTCPALSRDSALFSYAVIFAPLWMISSVAAQTSLAFTSVTTLNLFSASCPLFVLLLGALFGQNSTDAFTGQKLALVLLNLSGVCVVSRVSGSLLGSSIAMFSAVANAVYLFALSRFAANAHRQIDAILLLGIVGIFSLIVCTPLMFTLHNMGIERQLPFPTVHQLGVLVLNAFIGTLFADSVWLYATLLTGGLTSALSSSLGIPLSMLADSYMRNQPPNVWQVLSSIPIMISFIGASLITTTSIVVPGHHHTAQATAQQQQRAAAHKAKMSPPTSASSSSDDVVTTSTSSSSFDNMGIDMGGHGLPASASSSSSFDNIGIHMDNMRMDRSPSFDNMGISIDNMARHGSATAASIPLRLITTSSSIGPALGSSFGSDAPSTTIQL